MPQWLYYFSPLMNWCFFLLRSLYLFVVNSDVFKIQISSRCMEEIYIWHGQTVAVFPQCGDKSLRGCSPKRQDKEKLICTKPHAAFILSKISIVISNDNSNQVFLVLTPGSWHSQSTLKALLELRLENSNTDIWYSRAEVLSIDDVVVVKRS